MKGIILSLLLASPALAGDLWPKTTTRLVLAQAEGPTSGNNQSFQSISLPSSPSSSGAGQPGVLSFGSSQLFFNAGTSYFQLNGGNGFFLGSFTGQVCFGTGANCITGFASSEANFTTGFGVGLGGGSQILITNGSVAESGSADLTVSDATGQLLLNSNTNLLLNGGSTTGSFRLETPLASTAVVTNTKYDGFQMAGVIKGTKLGQVTCTIQTTTGAGTNGTLAIITSGGATLCSGSFICTTAAGTPAAVFNCATAPVSATLYQLALTTGCGTTNPTGLSCNVEITH